MKKVVILLISIALILIAFEIFFKLEYQGFRQNLDEAYHRNDFFKKSDVQGLFYVNHPSANEINEHGFRDEEWQFEKNEGIFRIVAVGDSVLYGLGTDYPKIITSQLQDKLPNKEKIEVIMLASPGYQTSQQLALTKNIEQMSPDLVLWFYVLNDISHPLYHDPYSLAQNFYYPDSYLTGFIESKIFFINERMIAQERNCNPAFYLHYLYCVYPDKLEKDIKLISEIQNKKGIPMVLFIFPTLPLVEDYKNYEYKYVHDNIKKFTAQERIETYDLIETLKDEKIPDIRQTWFWVDDLFHFNEKGYDLLSKYVIEVISPKIPE